MKFKRSDHNRFIQLLDRTAEKKPLLWLPCVLLITLALAGEHIAECAKIAYSHRNTDKVVKERTQVERKPFALRAVAMSLVMAFSFMLMSDLGQIVYADEYYYNDTSSTDWQNDINVTGNDPFGNMLADEFNAKSSEQEANAGYNVFSVEMQGNTAVVDYEAIQSSTLVVGIYDESGSQLITTSSIEVTAEANLARLDVDSAKIPQYFYIKAYLINTETMRPLCTVYECPTYTQEMQEFLSKTVYDFDADRVLNLDDDVTNNFAVFDENTVFIKENNSKNIVSSVDEKNLIYVIDNADEMVKSLSVGDIFSMEYGIDSMLIVKVKNITVDSDSVTIYGDKTELEEVFDYFRIEEATNGEESSLDPTSCGEGVTYLGEEYSGSEIATYSARAGLEDSVEKSHKVSLESEHINGTLSISSKATYKAYYDVHWFAKDHAYFELQVKNTMGIKISASEKSEAPFKIGEIKVFDTGIVNITVSAKIKITVEATISVSGKLTQTSGFKADSDSDVQDLSVPLKFEPDPSVKTEIVGKIKFELTVEISANIEVFKIKLFKAALSLTPFIEIVFKPHSNIISDDKQQHICTLCISGETHGGITVSFKIEVLKFIKWKPLNVTYDVKLFEFYWSIISDNPGFGMGNCPNIAYRVTTQVLDENQVPLSGANVTVDGKSYTTDENGKVKCYLKKGGYTVNVKKDGYESRSKNIKVFFGTKDIAIVTYNTNLIGDSVIKLPGGTYIKLPTGLMELIDGFEDLINGGSGDIPIDPDPIDPDPIDPDPIDPTPTESDFTYTISNGEVTITGYKGTDTDVVIPDTIEGLPVTSIGNKALNGCTSLTSITIPDSVISIGSYTFYNCTSLTNITIPDSVTSIGFGAFENCTSITSITIPDNVTSIGGSAFEGCTSLKNIAIPNGVTSVLYDTFYRCTNLTNVNIPDSVTSIGSSAFRGCTNLTFINIPDNVTSIGSGAFEECTSLTSITIPNGVTSVLYDTFYRCTNLTNVNIPDSVTSIGDSAFLGCANLTFINIPDNVTSIGYLAFCGCASLASITIPDNVTFIGRSTFDGCTSLESVNIPHGITSIGDNAFENCSSLTSIIIPSSVTSIGNKAFYDCISLINAEILNGVTSIGYDAFGRCTSLTSVTIPNSITSIDYGAFSLCTSLTSITIPDSVTSIGNDAFWSCTSLTSITIPGSVTSIEDSTFGNCTSLANAEILNGVTSIDRSAFSGCTSLASVTIPNSVTSIGNYAFRECECLANVTMSDSITSIGDHAFSRCYSLTSITIPNGVTSINDSAFESCTNLKSITIPNSVTSIGDDAFRGCECLTNVTMSNSIASIGDRAFYFCESLTDITIPDSVTTMGIFTFSMCTSLASINIPNGIVSIERGTFDCCIDLASITIPNSVISIGDEAFSNCKSLTDITIPDNVTSIGNSAFEDCGGLTSVTIPNGVISIGDSAFEDCFLKHITIPNSVTYIGDRSFHGYSIIIYCYSSSYAESYAIEKGISYVLIDNTTTNIIQHEPEETDPTPIIDTENNSDITDNPAIDNNDNLIENPEDTLNNEDLQETTVTVSEMALYNSYYDEPMYLASTSETSAYRTFTGLIPNEIYNCYGMKSRKAENPFNSSNLLFIAQGVSDSNGTLTFNYLPTEDYPNAKIFVKAMTEFDVDNAQIIFAEANDGSVSIGWNPVSGASQYKVYSITNDTYVEKCTTIETSCTITGITANCMYGFIVCSCINGEWSIPMNEDVAYFIHNTEDEEHIHLYGTEWKSNNTSHWHECTCGEKSDISAHTNGSGIITVKPTSNSTGIMTYFCTVCDYAMETEIIPEIPDHIDHAFGTDWKSDSTSHWHECICGEKADDTPHSYGIGIVTLEPTETTEGIRTYTCTICGYIINESIPIVVPDHTVHTFGTKWNSDSAYHWHECTVCGEHSDTAQHNENNVEDTVKPTATTSGIRTYYCSVCGYAVRTETIPPIGDPNPPYPINPTPSYPTVTYPTNIQTVKEPYIYGDTSKSGWDMIISEIDFAADSSTVRVNMNGTTELPKEVVSRIQNCNINLELNMNSTVWTINGLDVTKPQTVNLRVSERSNKIPTSVMENLISELEPKEYRLYHSGDFGFKATLTLSAGKKYNDYYAALYHYNTKTKQLEFVDENLVANRQVTFEITHASYYAVAFNSVPMYEDVSSSAGVFENSVPIETSAMPETSGVTIPAVKLPHIMKYSNKKRRYRILRKRRLDDLVFVM